MVTGMIRRLRSWVVPALTLMLGACGGSGSVPGEIDTVATTVARSETTPTTPAENAPETTGAVSSGAGSPSGGECTVVVTGDREETWTFEQNVYSMSSDYWMDEQELRDTVEFLGEDVTGGSYEEIVDRGEPIITFLSIGCVDADNLSQGALITPTNATRRTDFPMGAGNYPVSGGVFDANGPAATMIADFNVGPDELYGTVAGSGSLQITRRDLERIEGSYSFEAVEAFVDQPRKVSVSVTFSFSCAGRFSGC